MRVVEYSPSQKSKENQVKLLEQLSPAWLREQKVPLLTSTAPRQRKLAGVYLRYSTDHQDPYSFERQLKKIEAYAAVIGVDIVKVYGDPGTSGAFTANRPSYREMMEDAKQGKFQILIIEEPWSRCRTAAAFICIINTKKRTRTTSRSNFGISGGAAGDMPPVW